LWIGILVQVFILEDVPLNLQPLRKIFQLFQKFFFSIFPVVLVVKFVIVCAMFHSTRRCNREFKLRDKLMKENPERLRGFVLFLAELFQQLEIQASGPLSFNKSDCGGSFSFWQSYSSSWKYRQGAFKF
jgi:hypothetical protein